jgi:hypothetical protein
MRFDHRPTVMDIGNTAATTSLSGRNHEERDKNETDCANHRGHGRSRGVRYNPEDANLPRRVDGPCDRTLPAASAAASSSSASDRELPGRIDGSGRDELSASASTTAATAGTQVGRTRLNAKGRRYLRRPFSLRGAI